MSTPATPPAKGKATASVGESSACTTAVSGVADRCILFAGKATAGVGQSVTCITRVIPGR